MKPFSNRLGPAVLSAATCCRLSLTPMEPHDETDLLQPAISHESSHTQDSIRESPKNPPVTRGSGSSAAALVAGPSSLWDSAPEPAYELSTPCHAMAAKHKLLRRRIAAAASAALPLSHREDHPRRNDPPQRPATTTTITAAGPPPAHLN